MLAKRGAARDRRRTAAQSDPCDEAALFERVVGRDLRAFEGLYRTYHPRLTRFLLNMTRRPNLVEEVLDDTMLAVWNKPDSYDGRSKLSTWIFGIAYHKALKALRRQDEPMADDQAHLRPAPEPGPDAQLEAAQARDLLRQEIAGLSPDHRAVIDLCYFHELPYREIAQIMSCPVETVKTRMFHARRRLKGRLAGGPGDWLGGEP
jgi:RNA polymerase sigma factor (sigma-70 family)